MAELLLELLTEEIPARMQPRAADDLARLARERLTAAGLESSGVTTFVTPRRLTLVVEGLPKTQPDTSEERRGPRVGAPPAAIEGFLKSAGLASLDQCEQRDTGKGVFYFALIRRTGGATAALLPALLRGVILEMPWPKSMRFPAASFRWVRPLVSAICLFDGTVLALDLDRVPVGRESRGHRFLSPESFVVENSADYRQKLRDRRVVLRREDRSRAISLALYERAVEAELTVKDDPDLLEEVTGLVEWPAVLLGVIDPVFMAVPPEILTTAMRTHQKYFACLDRAGKLAPRFLIVSNMAAADGGKAIIAGNERVLRARLSDAQFFWEQDRKVKLAARVPKLAERVFHAKLGSVLDKVRRVERLAEALAPLVAGADKVQVRRAAELAKADLSSGMVGEFPELQGIMGRYYALHDGEAPEIAEAIAEHYSPLGPNDRCPRAPTSVAVALADKIDTLVGFFSIGERPTGSKDPFALRRAALGVIRLILENELRLRLVDVFGKSLANVQQSLANTHGGAVGVASRQSTFRTEQLPTAIIELMDFFADRLKVHLREQGVRHDLVAAVFALGGEDDLVRLLARVAALAAFLKTDDGANLLIAYRRAANIVRIEEKKDGVAYDAAPDAKLFAQTEEEALAQRLQQALAAAEAALSREAFTEAMGALASLRGPVDEFFARVTVNCDNPNLRVNRLRLLAQIRDTLNRVADFSQIEG
jgi:glycyl-tRNA synthetase beta chain